MKNAIVFAFFVFRRRIATGHGIVGGGERVLEEKSKK